VIALLFYDRRETQRLISAIGASVLLLSGIALFVTVRSDGILVSEMGAWPAPFGIVFVADLLAALMVMMAGLKAFTIAIYSLATMDPRRESFGYYPLLHILLMGINGSFLTGDMFNLFVWIDQICSAEPDLVSDPARSDRPPLRVGRNAQSR
jgi:multicomponent Na+:H+ antiporter subunit D